MYKVVFFSIALILTLSLCQNTQTKKEKFELGKYEIQGVSFVGMHYENELEYVEKLKTFQFNWISQMPFAFQKKNDPNVYFNFEKQWWGESVQGIRTTSEFTKKHTIKNLMKPQVWMGGEYTGKFTLTTENDWKKWEQSYSVYIYHFAHLADSLNHEALCIGTELHQTILNRPQFWNNLIDSIRTFYDGKITYASNWDEYQKVPFWQKLDWIGINAYFPLSKEKTPSTRSLVKAWQNLIPKLKSFSDSINKPIVFTEIGYKSVDFTAHEPWNPSSKTINLIAQKNAYHAFLHAFKNKKWFLGYFLWKWYPNHKQSGGEKDSDFTPQNKIVEKLFVPKI